MRVKPCLTRGELYCYAAGLKRFQILKKSKKRPTEAWESLS